jgi:hypothetical protein
MNDLASCRLVHVLPTHDLFRGKYLLQSYASTLQVNRAYTRGNTHHV